MSWYKPGTVAEMADSTRHAFSWNAQRFALAGDYVAVLSYHGMRGLLDDSHPLSDHVLTGAEAYMNHYMTTRGPEARKPHPSVTVYYVRDTRSRRVVLARQADGTVLDELDTIRPDLKQSARDALREAVAESGRAIGAMIREESGQ